MEEQKDLALKMGKLSDKLCLKVNDTIKVELINLSKKYEQINTSVVHRLFILNFFCNQICMNYLSIKDKDAIPFSKFFDDFLDEVIALRKECESHAKEQIEKMATII